MISLFRVYNEIILLLLLGITILLNLNVLFHPVNFDLKGYAPISGGLANILQDYIHISKWVYFILYIIVQFGCAIYFGQVMAKHKIVNQYNYVPALLFVSLLALINIYTFNCISFLLLPVFILLFHRVFLIATNDKNLTNAFDLGLITGTLFFTYFPYILLAVFAYFMFIVLTPFYWRDWVASVIGFVCPLLITLIVFAIFNESNTFFEYFAQKRSFLYSESIINTTNLMAHLIVVGAIIGILSLFSSAKQFKTTPFKRNYLFLIVTLAVLLLVFQLIRSLWIMELLIVVFIILAIVLTNYIAKCKSPLIKNALHLVLLVYLVYFQYFSNH